MRIALINDAFLPILNVGLASTIATLREEGHDVGLVDLLNISPAEAHDHIIEGLRRLNPEVIGICTGYKYDRLLQLVKRLREEFTSQPILIGGFVPTYFKRGLRQLQDADISNVWTFAGQTNREVAQFLKTYGQRDLPRDFHFTHSEHSLHHLPIPDFTLFDMPRYFKDSVMGEGYLPLYASKGCPFSCTYCGCRNRPHMTKEPERVLEEVLTQESRHRRHGMKWLGFRDPTFGYDLKQFDALMGLFHEEGLQERLPWFCSTRPEVITKDWAHKAARSGCFLVSVGLESSVENVRRDTLDRHYSNEQFKQAMSNLNEAGIWFVLSFMAGIPSTTFWGDLRTVIFASSFRPAGMAVCAYYPADETHLGESQLEGETGLPTISAAANRRARIQKITSLPFLMVNGITRFGWTYVKEVTTRLFDFDGKMSFGFADILKYPTLVDSIVQRPLYDLQRKEYLRGGGRG